MNIPYFDSTSVRAAAPWTTAIDAIEQALLNVVDPEDDSPRLFSPAPNGEFLLMPATNREYSGIKALTVAPANPARGLEKIQGVYILFHSDTSTPLATMDGNELTAIRTPATTLLAIKHILASAPRPAAPPHPGPTRVLVFGPPLHALTPLRPPPPVPPSARPPALPTDGPPVGSAPRPISASRPQAASPRMPLGPSPLAGAPSSQMSSRGWSHRRPPLPQRRRV